MSDTTIHDAPDLSLGEPQDDAWRRDQRAFADMLPSLLATHRGQYVAVHDGKVVASGPALVEVALEAYGRVGYVPVYVDLVTDQLQQPARIPSPRLPGPWLLNRFIASFDEREGSPPPRSLWMGSDEETPQR
ncbi:MAG TPA: DUF5678 domain-containing protein [Isosphaeraceae bacterium]